KQVGKEKMEIVLHEIDPELEKEVRQMAEADLKKAIQIVEKQARQDAIDAIMDDVVEKFQEKEVEEALIKDVKEVLHKIVKEEVRRLITKEKIRPDGRAIDEIRPLSSEVQIFPRTHGSGLFTRGQTQAL